MCRLETVVADGAGCRHGKVHEGSPSFQFVVMVVMEKKGGTNRSSRGGCFDGREGGMIVYDVVRKQNLLPATSTHVQG